MWHVAEGDLHAYLDGALEHYPPGDAERIRDHLERCSACAERLAEEARVRDRASAVLGMALPGDVSPTPLEELRRRAAADDGSEPATGGGSRTSRRVAWAWAATVVMALGVGWGVGGFRLSSGPAAGPVAPQDDARAAPSGRSAEGRGDDGADEAVEAGDGRLARAPAAEAAAEPAAARAIAGEEGAADAPPPVSRPATPVLADAGGEVAGAGAENAVAAAAPRQERRRTPTEEPTVQAQRVFEAPRVARERMAVTDVLAPLADRGPQRAPASLPLTGRVFDAGSMRPLAAVQVVAKGTGVGTLTDSSGRFTLEVPQEATTLVFSQIGYGTVEAPVDREVTVELEQTALALDELVVTGVAAPPARDSAGDAGERARAREREGSVLGALLRSLSAEEKTRAPAEPVRPTAARAAPDVELARRDASGPPPEAQRRERREADGEPSLEGAASLALPGLEVETVEWIEVAPGEQGVRVVQRLEDGTPLELRFVGVRLDASAGDGAPAAPPAPLPVAEAEEAGPVPARLMEEPLPAGWRHVARPFRGGWVVARGPLTEARLLALLGRMR